MLERERRAHGDLKRALVDEVRRRAAGRRPSAEMPAIDVTTFTRAKVEPMVRGLFPRSEQKLMLGVLERSVVFLIPDRVESILLGCTWLTSAWELANLYLGSLDAELLAEDAPRIVGLSEETTSFVSLDYFAETQRFADFIIHEAANVFHFTLVDPTYTGAPEAATLLLRSKVPPSALRPRLGRLGRLRRGPPRRFWVTPPSAKT